MSVISRVKTKSKQKQRGREMITRDNIKEVVASISAKDRRRIRKCSKEYVVIYLHVFNVGSYVTITLTNNYDRYKNVSSEGNCILSIDDDVFSNIIK